MPCRGKKQQTNAFAPGRCHRAKCWPPFQGVFSPINIHALQGQKANKYTCKGKKPINIHALQGQKANSPGQRPGYGCGWYCRPAGAKEQQTNNK